jgi:hypothetical protein
MNCFKNQFRPHNVSSCLMNDLNGAQGPIFLSASLGGGNQPASCGRTTFKMLCAGFSVRFFARLHSILTGLKSATVQSQKLYLVRSPTCLFRGLFPFLFPGNGVQCGRLRQDALDWNLQDTAYLRKK